MSGLGSKLSRHVLGMKFMRRTKTQIDKEKTETTFRQHFSKSSVKKEESRSASPATPIRSCEILEVGSYSQCEGHAFGRQSFGGFNPILESNVKKGIWKPFYLDLDDDDTQDNDPAASDSNVDSGEGEMEVSDEGMSKTFGSLVGTLGKRFLKKRDRGKTKEKSAKEQVSPNGESQKKKRRRGGRKKKSGGGGGGGEGEGDAPPKKKLKFMRPSE